MTQKTAPIIDLVSGIMLLTLAAVWGGSFFFAEIALREVPPMTVTLHRVFWAMPILLIVLWWQGIAIPRSSKIWLCYLMMGALNNAIPFSLIFWGQLTIESGLASILNGMTAIFGAVIAGLLLVDEPLTSRKLIGGALGLFGVAVIMGFDALSSLDPRNVAQLAVLSAGIFYSLASVWARKMLVGQPPLMNAFGMVAGTIVLMIPVAIWNNGVPSFSLSIPVWVSLISLSTFSTAFAYILYFRILSRAGAANLMLVTLLVPPFAVGLGILFLGETLGLGAGLGFILIALGLVVTDGRLWAYLRNKIAARS